MFAAASIVEYFKRNRPVIATAESCTAGKIITLLSEVDGGGACIESGDVVYSAEAKHRLFGHRITALKHKRYWRGCTILKAVHRGWAI
ncbi:CinA family protein [Pseudomonas sp. 58 R 3]|uniref:CinA family protein n=1 Tax=Pseudomonas sp. 58 R 3 TaxID=1844108 RepID=UPI000812A991|nr:CinA family protein [Pseudomonas sp. 58 R 3]CRM71842.1 competence damage-inducible protein A [Pseudomonas sp. 58 R 3]